MKSWLKPIGQYAAILVVGAVIVISTTAITNRIREPAVIEVPVKVITEKVLHRPDCGSDAGAYEELVSAGQFVRLIKDRPMHASGGRFVNAAAVRVGRFGQGEIACGFLKVRASIGGGSLDEYYDSIYIISPHELGGHLLRSRSSIDQKSTTGSADQVLLRLDNIPYLPSLPYNPTAQNFRVADWVNLINASQQTKFQIGLSTIRRNGIIEEVSIAYKCWDPETGKETTGCQLGVVE